MPPPRRRRPVQPATRVRLPRGPRPPSPNANGTVEAEPDETTVDAAAGVSEAGPAEETDEQPGDDDSADLADSADGEDAPELPAEAAERAGGKSGAEAREPLLLPICLGVATVILGGLAIWFGLNSGGSSASTGFGTGGTNLALTDTVATSQVNQQIDKAVDTIFSYNYTNTAQTAQAAKELLTGKASGEYATLFKVVQQDAPSEKLVLTTTVTNSGVEMLNGDTARLLIFANQKDTGATKASTTDAGAMFAVTAVHQDGKWKIEDINTFTASG